MVNFKKFEKKLVFQKLTSVVSQYSLKFSVSLLKYMCMCMRKGPTWPVCDFKSNRAQTSFLRVLAIIV